MKPINEITGVVIDLKTNNFKYRPPFMNKEEFSEQDYALVNELFKTLIRIFPAFKQAWPTTEEFEGAKREWMKAFKLAKVIDSVAIQRGVDKYRLASTPFVPSPGQFIAMCGVHPDQDRCKLPFFEKYGIESDEVKERRKNSARKHLDALYETLKK
jgi:Replication protein P